jgi:hypothetical protein
MTPTLYDLHVSGAARFRRSLHVPATGAIVKLTRRTKQPDAAKFWIGATMSVAGALAAVLGAYGIADATAPDIGLMIGGVVVGITGFVLLLFGGSEGDDDAIVLRKASMAHGLRFVGVGARATDRRTIVPSLTFEFE